jgi:hypothetical protein
VDGGVLCSLLALLAWLAASPWFYEGWRAGRIRSVPASR